MQITNMHCSGQTVSLAAGDYHATIVTVGAGLAELTFQGCHLVIPHKPEEMPLCHYRLQGYVQALRRCGIMVDPQYIARGDFTFEAGSKAMQQLLDLPQPPTAVFCHSDVMALGALSQAKRQGLKVPEDLSIIGFDNIDLTQFCDPPLTTIAQPRYEIGREAMLLLLDQMQGQHVGSGSRLMDCELIIRGSTRALP
nr:transcriptional (co)regulator CytR [uncultured bacterium]